MTPFRFPTSRAPLVIPSEAEGSSRPRYPTAADTSASLCHLHPMVLTAAQRKICPGRENPKTLAFWALFFFSGIPPVHPV